MGSGEQYCLRWNNHQANLLDVCAQLLRDERLVDVTLACADEGRCIRAHKVVLSACSAYFRALFIDHPARHPIVILKDVRFTDLRTIVEFMYKGEVRVEYAQLSRLLQTAESLKVKGLAEMTRDYKEPPEQTEPEELVSRRHHLPTTTTPPPPPPCLSPPLVVQERTTTSPPPPCSLVLRPPSQNGSSPETVLPPASSSFGPEPVAGPSSTLPPVQQVPLSLKKEVEWDEKNSGGESSSEYSTSRIAHDSPLLDVERSSSGSSRASTPGSALLPFPLAGLLEAGLVVPPGTLDGLASAAQAFRCGACLAGFPSPWLLEQHAALQHLPSTAASGADKPFVCDQCGQSYRYRSAYVKHREQNHRARLPADKLFSCDVCGMQFRYLKSFKKHRLNHALERLHGRPRPPAPPTTTTTTTDSSAAAGAIIPIVPATDDHVTSSSNDKPDDEEEEDEEMVRRGTDSGGGASELTTNKVEPIKVEDCEEEEGEEHDDTVDSREGVALALPRPLHHMSNVGGAGQRERRFACPFCGKCVRSKENLKLHVRKHTGERPFVCLFCGRAFGGKSDLTRHLRIHTGERPYHCDMCGKCFARADYLSKHLTTHINTPR